MKTVRVGIASVLIGLLVACASFDQRLATAYSVNTGLRDVATSALENQLITSDDAQYALDQTRNNRKMLDTAKHVAHDNGDLASAEGRLSLVERSLKALRAYLNDQGVK